MHRPVQKIEFYWNHDRVRNRLRPKNAAERALRGPVIHRKLSHGTCSHDGERFIERALSASVTCRLQGRSLFAYLGELLTASARGQPLPALA
jgi:transposase